MLMNYSPSILLRSAMLFSQMMRASDANTYDVLNATNLIICENSIADLNKMLGE